jgi:hypothetical protein
VLELPSETANALEQFSAFSLGHEAWRGAGDVIQHGGAPALSTAALAEIIANYVHES